MQPEDEAFRLAFEEEKLNWELLFFECHYLRGYKGLEPAETKNLKDEFTRLATELAGFSRCLCHRDYHVRNLMLKDGTIYITDFQDARQGPASYDLVALLKDSIDLETQEINEYRDYYLDRASLSQTGEAFMRQFHLMWHSTPAQGFRHLWLPNRHTRQFSLPAVRARFAATIAHLLASCS